MSPSRIQPVSPAPDLEARVRQLELWSVSAHSHLEAIEERAQGFLPVIRQLQEAAATQAAITTAQAQERERSERKSARLQRAVSVAAGAAGVLTLGLKIVGRA